MPEGYWLRGRPFSRSRSIFLRYATRNDRKQRGSDRRSEYYRRHGNPNFFGMTGIISESMRKRLRGRGTESLPVRQPNVSDNVKDWSGYNLDQELQDDLRDLGDDMFSNTDQTQPEEKDIVEDEMDHEKELDLLLRNRKQIVTMRLYSDIVAEQQPKTARQRLGLEVAGNDGAGSNSSQSLAAWQR